MTWQRPKHLPYPNIWSRFEGKVLINGKPLRYRIQDITEELIEPVLDHISKYFFTREVSLTQDAILEDEESMREMREMWRDELKQRIGLVAIVEGHGDITKRIAGCNILSVVQKKDPKQKEFKGQAMRRRMRVTGELYEKEDIFTRFGVDKYLTGSGMCVAPHYQGDNVGYHLLQARSPICHACGINLTVTIFSHPKALNEAKKAGFEVIGHYALNKLKFDGELYYPRIKAGDLTVTVKLASKL